MLPAWGLKTGNLLEHDRKTRVSVSRFFQWLRVLRPGTQGHEPEGPFGRADIGLGSTALFGGAQSQACLKSLSWLVLGCFWCDRVRQSLRLISHWLPV